MEQPKTTIHAPDNQGTVIGKQNIETQNNYGADENKIKYFIQNALAQEGTSAAALANLGLSSELADKLIKESELKDLSPEARHQFLVDSVVNYKIVQQRLDDMMGRSPLIQDLMQDAKTLLEQGDFKQADNLIQQARDALNHAGGNEFLTLQADLLGTRGYLAMAQWRFEDATEFYGDAYAFVKNVNNTLASYYLDKQADASYEDGDKKGKNDSLRQSITLYEKLLKQYDMREKAPQNWARTQMNLGTVLWTLGIRESGTENLHKAVTAYESASLECTRERSPLNWAGTQMGLGNVLANLGTRESGTETLYKAVTAYENASLEYTRERVPLDWAGTQMNLGIMLWTLGTRKSGTETLQKAVKAYDNALLEYTRERVPLNWAGTQMNLGIVLTDLGRRESGTETLYKAVTAFENALLEYTQERVPLQWAGTQNSLGNVLTTLGTRESGTDTLHKAVTAYNNALLERTRERVPLNWARTQMNLGLCFNTLGDRTQDKDYYRKGITALKNARDVYVNEAKQVHHKEWFDKKIAGIEKKL